VNCFERATLDRYSSQDGVEPPDLGRVGWERSGDQDLSGTWSRHQCSGQGLDDSAACGSFDEIF